MKQCLFLTYSNTRNLDPKTWKKIFYRAVDSAGNQDSVDLRDIEEDMFRKTKVDVVNATGPWIGSSEQNKMADLKISTFVRNSFKSYEKSRPIGEKSYFKF